ncbi:MAG: fatty acid desaturase [Burkholderiales bacterium]|nr:fatty acid desaturase [Phycisphaerae bacterium]
MNLWSPAHEWAHDRHDEPPLTLFTSIVMWFTVLLPYAGLIALVVFTITFAQDWLSLGFFVGSYLCIGFGVTVGYHRLLAHRAFNTYRWVELMFLIFGCMAMQGPPIRWAATHRRHHQKSDHEGDPHSPHLHGTGAMGVLRGLWHAHTGWLLTKDAHRSFRSVKDLLESPMIRFIDRYYWLWLILSVLIPFSVGYAVRGTAMGGLACVFWAVIVRITLMHHATWSVNSICHVFGYRSFKSTDESRNNPVIAIISLGEGWHNNHHAFPTSARHGLRWFEFDVSYVVIRTFELLGLAWDVRRPSAHAMTEKAIAA